MRLNPMRRSAGSADQRGMMIGPPQPPAPGSDLPVTVVPPWRGPRRAGAHPLTSPEQRPLTLVAFEPRQLRRSVVSVLLIVTLWLVALGVFAAIGHFLFILLLSWLFAIAMEPAILRLTTQGMSRSSATGVVGTFVVVCVIALAGVFGQLFFTQLQQLVTSVPTTVDQGVGWINQHTHFKLDPTQVSQELRLTPEQITNWTTQIAGGVLGIVTSAFSLLLEVFTFFVFAFYIAADGPRIRRAIGRWLPPQRQEVFVTVWDIAAQKTGGYVISKIVLAALSASFHAVFFWAIGVPYWLPLALLVGITAQFIPVVGTYIGIAVPLLFVVFAAPLTGLWILVFATVYQQVENYVFTPRVSRRTMDVNGGIALAAVFIGAGVWGPIGALIGIPLAAAVVAVVGTYGRRYELVPELAAPELEDDEVVTEGESTGKGADRGTDAGRAAAAHHPDAADGATDTDPPPVEHEPKLPSDDEAPVLSKPSS